MAFKANHLLKDIHIILFNKYRIMGITNYIKSNITIDKNNVKLKINR